MNNKKTLIIGTGYLGRCIIQRAKSYNLDIISTYNTKQYFPTSIAFDFLKETLSNKIDISGIKTVVLTLNIKSDHTIEELRTAISNFLEQIKNTRLIYISSDAIFDGQRGLYSEQDEPNPVTEYGKNKKLFEDLIKSKIKNYCIIRPSYIYGYSCGCLDRRLQTTVDSVNNRLQVEVFDDMYKSPIDVNQLSELIIKQFSSDFVGVVHAGGERISVYDFKKQALDAMGLPTTNLTRIHIPKNHPIEMLRDTSLNNSLMKKTAGIVPHTIEHGLQQNHQFRKPQSDFFNQSVPL